MQGPTHQDRVEYTTKNKLACENNVFIPSKHPSQQNSDVRQDSPGKYKEGISF